MTTSKQLTPVGYLNKVTGHIWTPIEQPDAADQPGIYEPLGLSREALAVVQQKDALQLSVDNILRGLGITGDGSVSQLVLEKFIALQAERDALAAENLALKKDLMFWDNDDPELPFDHPVEIASACEMSFGTEFTVQVAARMPKRTYRVTRAEEYEYEVEMVEGAEIETPATDAAIAEIKAQGLEQLANACEEGASEEGCSCNHASSLRVTKERAERYALFLRAGRKG